MSKKRDVQPAAGTEQVGGADGGADYVPPVPDPNPGVRVGTSGDGTVQGPNGVTVAPRYTNREQAVETRRVNPPRYYVVRMSEGAQPPRVLTVLKSARSARRKADEFEAALLLPQGTLQVVRAKLVPRW